MEEKANLDWPNLDFSYRKTDWNLRFTWKDGVWSEGTFTRDETIPLHMASSCLHYGQECFEGLKAFSTNSDAASPDGSFRSRGDPRRGC